MNSAAQQNAMKSPRPVRQIRVTERAKPYQRIFKRRPRAEPQPEPEPEPRAVPQVIELSSEESYDVIEISDSESEEEDVVEVLPPVEDAPAKEPENINWMLKEMLESADASPLWNALTLSLQHVKDELGITRFKFCSSCVESDVIVFKFYTDIYMVQVASCMDGSLEYMVYRRTEHNGFEVLGGAPLPQEPLISAYMSN